MSLCIKVHTRVDQETWGALAGEAAYLDRAVESVVRKAIQVYLGLLPPPKRLLAMWNRQDVRTWNKIAAEVRQNRDMLEKLLGGNSR